MVYRFYPIFYNSYYFPILIYPEIFDSMISQTVHHIRMWMGIYLSYTVHKVLLDEKPTIIKLLSYFNSISPLYYF